MPVTARKHRMPGEIDTLRVKIESSADHARQNIQYLVSALSDLKSITKPTVERLAEVNAQLSEMGGLLRGFKQMSNPTKAFSSGIEKAVKKAQDLGGAVQKAVDNTNKLATAGKMVPGEAAAWNVGNKAAAEKPSQFPTLKWGEKEYRDASKRLYDWSVKLLDENFRLRESLQKTSKASEVFRRITTSALNGVKNAFHGLGKAVHSVTGRISRFFHSIVRIATYRTIRSALRALTQGFSEGIENLYLWSQAVGTNFAPTMDRLASSMLYLKNGFAAMFSPLIEYFAPYIETFVDKLVEAFNWVQRLFAQLTGKDTWNKAVKVQTTYKESAEDTTKAVKALRQEIQLMDFDELNNITESPDRGSSSAEDNTPNPNPEDMFVVEVTPVEPLEGDSIWERIKNLFGDIDWQQLGEEIGSKIREWWNNIKWDQVFGTIWNVIKNAAKFIYGIFLGLNPWFKDYLEKKREEKERAEQAEREQNRIREEAGRGNQGGGGSFEPSFSGLTSTIDDLNNQILREAKVRKEAEAGIKALFTDKNGNYNQDLRDSYDYMLKNLSPLEIQMQRMLDPTFKAYMDYLGIIEDSEKRTEDLMKKRQTEAQKSLALTRKAEQYYKQFAKEVDASTAEVMATTIAGLTSDDWKNGGENAMKKLENALRLAGIPEATIEIAKKSAMGFAKQSGWLDAGAKTAKAVKDAVEIARIPDKYKNAASEALNEYLNRVDWENGGKISTREIYEALDKAGVDREYAALAAEGIYAYLSDDKWKKGGEEAGEEVATATTETAEKTLKEQFKDLNAPEIKVKASLTTTKESLQKEIDGTVKLVRPKELKIKTGVGTTSKDLTDALNEKIKYASPNAIKIPHSIPVTSAALKSEMDKKIAGFTPEAVKIPIAFNHGKIQIKVEGTGKDETDTRTLTFAEGGYPRMGSMFIAGEAGAEMVGSINGRTGVASGQEITGIGDAVWSTGSTTATLLEELISVVRSKNLTLSPSAALGRTVSQSQRLYAMQTG